jgi:hypothetical protein
VTQRLQSLLGRPTKAVYMNINMYSTSAVLPTTRMWLKLRKTEKQRRGLMDVHAPPRPVDRAETRSARSRLNTGVRLVIFVSEELARYLQAANYRRRGYVVFLDRHFLAEFYGSDVGTGSKRSWDRRVHGFFLDRVYPRPDLVVCLDAPGDVLFSRKREYSSEWLESLRQRYLASSELFMNFAVVDATKPLDDVVREVEDLILEFAAAEPTAKRPSRVPLRRRRVPR